SLVSAQSFSSFFFCRSALHRHLHSFPTRRSFDLARRERPRVIPRGFGSCCCRSRSPPSSSPSCRRGPSREASLSRWYDRGRERRSEEHTSKLQSRSDLVCRLLLEKKKN